MWPSNTCVGLKTFVITELTITTLFCPGIKGAALDVLTRTLLHLQQAEQFKKVLIKHGCLTVLASANPIGYYWARISPSMSIIVIGHLLLYYNKDDAVWCVMFINLMIVVVGIKIPGIHSKIRSEYLLDEPENEQWNELNKELHWIKALNKVEQ